MEDVKKTMTEESVDYIRDQVMTKKAMELIRSAAEIKDKAEKKTPAKKKAPAKKEDKK